jgi:hypothetical protein
MNKSELIESAMAGEFENGPQRFRWMNDSKGTIVEIFDGGGCNLEVVEIWDGERLGNECWLHTFPDDDFVPVDDDATN